MYTQILDGQRDNSLYHKSNCPHIKSFVSNTGTCKLIEKEAMSDAADGILMF